MAMDIKRKTPEELFIESIVLEKTQILQKEINKLKKELSDLRMEVKMLNLNHR